MYIYNLLKTMVNEKQNHQPIEGCIQNRTKKKKKKAQADLTCVNFITATRNGT